jgi:hypothetical protein
VRFSRHYFFSSNLEHRFCAHPLLRRCGIFLATFSETSSQTFQAFLPQFEYSTSVKTKQAAKQLVWKLQTFAASVGMGVATVGGAVATFGAGLFTADPAVAAALKPLALPLFLAAALHSLICSAEGVLLVRKDLGFLGKVYALSAVVMPLALLALKQQGAGLLGVWVAFVGFQATRVVILNCRVHKKEQPSAAAEAAAEAALEAAKIARLEQEGQVNDKLARSSLPCLDSLDISSLFVSSLVFLWLLTPHSVTLLSSLLFLARSLARSLSRSASANRFGTRARDPAFA